MSHLDADACYRVCSGREARFDGQFYIGVASTGIFCLPSCPAPIPRRENCSFFPTATAALAAGFRACGRCRPDIGCCRLGPDPDTVASRAVRLIGEGFLDEASTAELARLLGVSERQLQRRLATETGMSAHRLARARRIQAARTLIAATNLSFTEVAFAAGFGNTRRFSDAMRAEFGCAPGELRGHQPEARCQGVGELRLGLLLPGRAPVCWPGLWGVLTAHAVPGVEHADGQHHERLVATRHGAGVVRLLWPPQHCGHIRVALRLPRLDAVSPTIAAMRRWLDLDTDPAPIDRALGSDRILGPLVGERPGLRVPGVVDGAEFALFVVLGQQVCLAAARTLQARLVERFGVPALPEGGWKRIDPSVLAEAGPERLREALRLTGAKAQALHALAVCLANGLDLSAESDPELTRERLLAVRGIGGWTSEFIAMRALGVPDACPTGDLVLARALGVRPGREVARCAERWRPWRGYATMHLWTEESYLGESAWRSAGNPFMR